MGGDRRRGRRRGRGRRGSRSCSQSGCWSEGRRCLGLLRARGVAAWRGKGGLGSLSRRLALLEPAYHGPGPGTLLLILLLILHEALLVLATRLLAFQKTGNTVTRPGPQGTRNLESMLLKRVAAAAAAGVGRRGESLSLVGYLIHILIHAAAFRPFCALGRALCGIGPPMVRAIMASTTPTAPAQTPAPTAAGARATVTSATFSVPAPAPVSATAAVHATAIPPSMMSLPLLFPSSVRAPEVPAAIIPPVVPPVIPVTLPVVPPVVPRPGIRPG